MPKPVRPSNTASTAKATDRAGEEVSITTLDGARRAGDG